MFRGFTSLPGAYTWIRTQRRISASHSDFLMQVDTDVTVWGWANLWGLMGKAEGDSNSSSAFISCDKFAWRFFIDRHVISEFFVHYFSRVYTTPKQAAVHMYYSCLQFYVPLLQCIWVVQPVLALQRTFWTDGRATYKFSNKSILHYRRFQIFHLLKTILLGNGDYHNITKGRLKTNIVGNCEI